MFSRQITSHNILRVLAAGFSLVILLLVVAGVIGIGNLRPIEENAASLVNEQNVTTSLVDEIQREQGNLNAVFYTLDRELDQIDRDQIQKQLDASDQEMDRTRRGGLRHQGGTALDGAREDQPGVLEGSPPSGSAARFQGDLFAGPLPAARGSDRRDREIDRRQPRQGAGRPTR
jgi:hypothetical protein